jgi:hypothetical protein
MLPAIEWASRFELSGDAALVNMCWAPFETLFGHYPSDPSLLSSFPGSVDQPRSNSPFTAPLPIRTKDIDLIDVSSIYTDFEPERELLDIDNRDVNAMALVPAETGSIDQPLSQSPTLNIPSDKAHKRVTLTEGKRQLVSSSRSDNNQAKRLRMTTKLRSRQLGGDES